MARIPQIDRNFADFRCRFVYKNQYLAEMLGAQSWRTRWVKRAKAKDLLEIVEQQMAPEELAASIELLRSDQ